MILFPLRQSLKEISADFHSDYKKRLLFDFDFCDSICKIFRITQSVERNRLRGLGWHPDLGVSS